MPMVSEQRVLIAEDDKQVREALERALRFEGYAVSSAPDGAAALAAFDDDEPDVLVLDVSMPVVDGISVCRRLRARGDTTPVLMLTARSDIEDRVTGLDAGADDYLAKPFALEELLARIRALLRRVEPDDSGKLVYDDLELDFDGRTVTRAGQPIDLTPTEFEILATLMRQPGKVFDRSTLYTEIWGYESETSSKALDVHARLVRRKLEANGESRLLHTIHGIGYVVRTAPASDQ